jgi:hypothetical protein
VDLLWPMLKVHLPVDVGVELQNAVINCPRFGGNLQGRVVSVFAGGASDLRISGIGQRSWLVQVVDPRQPVAEEFRCRFILPCLPLLRRSPGR